MPGRQAGVKPARKRKRSTAPVMAPSDLHLLEVIDIKGDVEVTVEDRIIAYMATGADLTECAVAAGVSRQTVAKWLSDAAQAERKQVAIKTGADPYARLTKNDKLLIRFGQRAQQARAEWQIRLAGAGMKLATGEFESVVTTEKVRMARDEHGNVLDRELVERVEKRATVLPSADMVKFMLERRAPESWRNTDAAEGPATGVGHVVVDLPGLLDKVADRLAEAELDARKRAEAEQAAGLPTGDVIDAEVVSDSDEHTARGEV